MDSKDLENQPTNIQDSAPQNERTCHINSKPRLSSWNIFFGSVKEAIVPKFAQSVDEGKRRQSLWQPVSDWMSTVNIFPHSKGAPTPNTQKDLSEKTSSYTHYGKHHIGIPTRSKSMISDDFYRDLSERVKSDENLTVWHQTPKLEDLVRYTVETGQEGSTFRRKTISFMEQDHLGRLSLCTSDQPVIVRMNISGVKFHVLHTTLQKDPFVYGKIVEEAMWLPLEKEYYFERDPHVFRFIHNYLRRGEVHLPREMCGPLLEKELDDWGVSLGLDIQRCCLGPVLDSKSKLNSLRKFEKQLEAKPIRPNYWIKSLTWQSFREKVWNVIEVVPSVIEVHRDRSHGVAEGSNLPTEQPSLLSMGTDEISVAYLSCPIGSDPKTDEIDSEPAKTTTNSFQSPNVSPMGSEKDQSVRNHTLIYWLRRSYVACEALVVVAALLVFIVSTIPHNRVPLFYSNLTREVDNNNTTTTNSNNTASQNTTLINFQETPFTIPKQWLMNLNIFLSTLITIDVLMRMVFCPALKPWICSIYTIIDILSLIPFYCELVLIYVKVESASKSVYYDEKLIARMEQCVGILNVFIVLRLFRILRRSRNTCVLFYTIRTTIIDMGVIVVLLFESALFFGSAIYFLDANFTSVPSGSWWAFITMSTVGYGDLVPNSLTGYLLGTACVIVGILLTSYTVPILVNSFLLYYDHADQLCLLKQLHRTAKHEVRKRRLLKFAQKARAGAREFVNATLTSAMAKVNSTMQSKSNNSKMHVGWQISN